MAPIRRPKDEPAPIYREHSNCFTVEVIHGGFFIGSGTNRSYVDGRRAWFDFCEMESWSEIWVEYMVEDLGYEKAGRVAVYWSLPGKDINENGIRLIKDESCTNSMVEMVKCGHRFLVVYLDHDGSINGYDWNDSIAYTVAPLPHVFSPKKVAYVETQSSETLPTLYTDFQSSRRVSDVDDHEEESGDESEDSDFVPELIDSDYEIEDGDDDLFEDHVVDLVDQNVGQVAEHEDESEDDNIELPDSDDDQVRFKFNYFREEDMHNPEFRVGHVFTSVDPLRKAIKEYSCKNRVNINLPKNDRKRIGAQCAPGCPWSLWASYDSRSKCIMIKRYNGEHNCRKEWRVRAFTSKFLAGKYIDSFRADDRMTLRNFARMVQKDWNMTPSRSKLGRARKIAMDIIYGDEIGQYNLLWDYGAELRRSNPGSNFFLKLHEGRFEKLYMSFDACKRGFMAGCRSVICLDGCHIKTKFGGQLLTAVSMDPNDCIYPVAMAVVEVEDTTTWRWFLAAFKQDLGIVNTSPWTIMSDKQKGLIKAVREQFPDSEHRFCVRHLYQNFQKIFKGDSLKTQTWKIARSSSVMEWQENMDEMKTLSNDAHAWLEELPPNTWVRAFFADFSKYILDAREMPILSMIERIKQQIMSRIYNKQTEAHKWTGGICPKIRKRVQKNAEMANICYATPAGEGIFEVQDKGRQYIIDLKLKHCTCRRWDLSGIPCSHAISCMRHERIPPEEMVTSCFSIESFYQAYGSIIMPCNDMRDWEKTNGRPILPPKYDKKAGRPKKNRRKQPYEKETYNGKKMTKHRVVMHCGHCGKADHNRRGCEDFKAGRPPKKQIRRRIRAHPESDDEDERVITQDETNQFSGPIYAPEMINTFTVEKEKSQRDPLQATPLPESGFIQSHIMTQRPVAPTTATRDGSQTRKLYAKKKAVAAEKVAPYDELLDATVHEASLEEQVAAEALKKAAEAAAKKEAIAQKKAIEAAAKKAAGAEKRAAQAEAKKAALAEKKAAQAAKKEAVATKRTSEAQSRQEAQSSKKTRKSSIFSYLMS